MNKTSLYNKYNKKASLSNRLKRTPQHQNGFTIVELLIVIVVIAILAAITIVAYNGITQQAKEEAVKSDLRSGATQLGLAQVETGSYPADTSGLKKGDATTFQYTGGGSSFCLTATSSNLPGKTFHITEGGSIQNGACPAPTTMQAFTRAQCQALATFTGSNNQAIVNLTDSRGGIQRTYQVAKLADGKCWMLNNLKLGSTSGSITLTPSDSNVASSFTLPQLATTGIGDYDIPGAYGPVPGDTGSGATNYGYLYNWPAATAGETRASHPANAGNAPYSICPANWRLPSGAVATSDFGQLDVAFGGTGAYVDGSPSIPSWQPTGPFKGAFTGYWWNGSFDGQGGGGSVWSRSANPSYVDLAFGANFVAGYIFPGEGGNVRSDGIAIRCLLN